MIPSHESHEGGCLCGAVRYRASGRPLWVAHCHCRSCRRASGAAFVTWAGFAQAAFAVTAGEPAQFASSPGVARGFCAACGSPLTYQAERFAGEVHVTVGTLDVPEAFPPEVHVWCAHALPWVRLDDGLPRHAGFGDAGGEP